MERIEFSRDSKKREVEMDISGIEYLRIGVEVTDYKKGGYILIKDAFVYTGTLEENIDIDPATEEGQSDLQSIIPDTVQLYVHTYGNDIITGGENWNGSMLFMAGDYKGEPYADYYLGRKFDKLRFKVAPSNIDFTDSLAVLQVLDQQTGELLKKIELVMNNEMQEVEVKVSGIEYLRISVINTNYNKKGYILIKDAVVYSGKIEDESNTESQGIDEANN